MVKMIKKSKNQTKKFLQFISKYVETKIKKCKGE